MKIAHILSEEKFIDKHINKYESSEFDNFYFYLRNDYKYSGKYAHKLEYIQPESASYIKLVENIETYDLVILYFLQRPKLEFLEDIRTSKVIIIWSFYGAELYDLPLLRYRMLSEKTLRALNMKWHHFHLGKVKDFFRTLRHFIKGTPTAYQRLKKALPRIDYFLWYNPYEYDFLNSFFNGHLPTFVPYSITDVMDHVVPNLEKDNSILIGHSRAIFNNHLDAIDLLVRCKFEEKISIPFSYGNNERYISEVKRAAVSSRLRIEFIEKFVPFNEYIEDLNRHCAAIYPSFRQIGLGNILIAIRCGLKIYLSEKNPTLKWMSELGFSIFSIERDLETDVVNGNLRLDNNLIDLNNRIYSKLIDKNNDLLFFEELKKIHLKRALVISK